MKATYRVSSETKAVCLHVTVSTPGEASTIVWKMKGEESEEVAANDTKDPTGCIPKTKIGDCSLAGFDIRVDTDIDLELVDRTLWNNAFNNLVIEYTFSGGIDGDKVFRAGEEDKSRDSTRSYITVQKKIRITDVE